MSVEDDSGIAPIYQYTSDGLSTSAYAVYRDENDNDDIHYKVAIKRTETINSVSSISWNILKVSQSGIIDYQNSFTTDSITSLEDEFNQDLNDDGNKTGQVSLVDRSYEMTVTVDGEEQTITITDSPSSNNVGLKEESGGSLYIVDGSTNIKINESNIERDTSLSLIHI